MLHGQDYLNDVNKMFNKALSSWPTHAWLQTGGRGAKSDIDGAKIFEGTNI